MKKRFLIAVFILAAILFAYLILYKNDSAVVSNGTNLDLFDKIKSVETTGGTIALGEIELNNALLLYLKNGRSVGCVTIRNIYVKLTDDNITFFTSIQYKSFSFLLSSNGFLAYENDNITYTPKNFKVGKLPIPKHVIFKVLLKHSSPNISLKNNNIIIDKNILPFSISNISIKDSKLLLTIDKFVAQSSLFPGVNTDSNKIINQAQVPKEQGALIQNSIFEPINQIGNTSKDAQDNDTPKQVEITPSIPKAESSAQQNLIKISGQLSSAIVSLNNSKEQQVISMIQSSINSTISNPSHNFNGDIVAVKSMYNKLTQSQKNNIKVAIISNVDARSANQLRNAFGL